MLAFAWLALRLAGAADAYRDTNEFSLPVPIAEIIDRWLAPARASAGAAARRLIAEGRRLTPEAAVELALRSEPEEARGPGPRQTPTPREAEVATHAFIRPDGLPVIFLPMRGHRWRLALPFAGARGEGPPSLEEIQRLNDQWAPWPVIG